MVEPDAASVSSPRVIRGSRLVWYVAILVVGFAVLYVLTRSPMLIADGAGFVTMARDGDPAELHYGEPSHFLQVPLARAVWRIVEPLGLPVESIFLAFSLAGTLAAIVFVGLIAAEILQTEAAGWLAAILFGTALNPWTQWNGELYGLALGFVTAGLFFTLRGRVATPAWLWGLSILSHFEFALAAPAFILAAWMAQPAVATTRERLRKVPALLGLAATISGLGLLVGSWMVGKWSDGTSFVAWLQRSVDARERDIAMKPEILRAVKGLVTAFSVAGHYWRDVLTNRGAYANPAFLPAAGVGLLVLAVTGISIAMALKQRRVAVFAVAWLLPFHVIINWWFVPTVEKYHGGALPGFVLLVTAGLITLAGTMPARGRQALYVVYVLACAGLNLFGAVVPMQALGRDTFKAARELRQLSEEHGGRIVLVACDASRAIVESEIPFLRLRSVWRGTVPEIQQTVLSWTSDSLREGRETYIVGRWCFPEAWKTTWSKAPFDLFFLGQSFKIVPTSITGIPVSMGVSTNPFSWTSGDVVGLEPLERSATR